jgi:hypothetical protein
MKLINPPPLPCPGLPGQGQARPDFYANGRTDSVSAKLDTLLIEPDSMKVSMVWRTVIPTPPELAVAEIRLMPYKQ